MYSSGAVSYRDEPQVPLPPAVTQHAQPHGGDRAMVLLEPFRFGRGSTVSRIDLGAERISELELTLDVPPLADAEAAADADSTLGFEGMMELAADPATEEEGTAEPAFQEDVNEMTAALRASAEHEHELVEPTRELAERLERLSRRLRAEDVDSLLPSLAKGDRFDTLVAGFLAGYFSAKDD
jgi:hypothetical protein